MLLNVWGQEQKPMRRVADEYFMRYEYGEAAIRYEDILRHRKKVDPALLQNLATSYRKMNRYQDAADTYAKVTADTKAGTDDFLYYGDMLKSLGRYEDAKTQYNQYLQKGGSQPMAQDRIAGCEAAMMWKAHPTGHVIKNARSINSTYAEWGGVYFKNNILFTSDTLRKDELDSRSRRNKQSYGWTLQDQAKLYAQDTLSNGAIRIRDLSPVLNKFKYHVGPLVFTNSYDTVIFTVTDPSKPHLKKVKHWPLYGTRRLMMYRSINKDGVWQPATSFPYNKPDQYSVGHAALSQDNHILYFASDMPGGKGGTDIWYCVRQADGTLGTPMNCGDVINTPEDEQFPTIDEDGNLCFSSKGHVGMGGFDLFKTEGSKDQWTKPENLGYPRNSPGDDFYYVTNGPNALLSSNRAEGRGDDDIYYLQLPLQYVPLTAVPILTIKLEGSICPQLKFPCVYLYNRQRNIGWCFVPGPDGRFDAMLQEETDYVIRSYQGGVVRDSLEFNTRGVKGPVTLQKSLCPTKP